MSNSQAPLPTIPPKHAAAMAIEISLPPDELRKHIAILLAAGMNKCKPPCVIVEKIKATELEGLASFVIGGFLAMAAGSTRGH